MFKNFECFKKTVKFNKVNYEKGLLAEIRILVSLQIFFDDKTIKQLDEGNNFDFEGDEKFIELKSRNCYSYAFKDTCIGEVKINKAIEYEKLGKNIYFVFEFLDGTYFWKFDKNCNLRKGLILNKRHCFIEQKLLERMEIKK